MDTHPLQAHLRLRFTLPLQGHLQELLTCLRRDRHNHHRMRHNQAHPSNHLIKWDTPRRMRRPPHSLRDLQRFHQPIFLGRREGTVRRLHLDLLDSLVDMGRLLDHHHHSRRMAGRLSSLSINNILNTLAHLTSLPMADGLELV